MSTYFFIAVLILYTSHFVYWGNEGRVKLGGAILSRGQSTSFLYLLQSKTFNIAYPIIIFYLALITIVLLFP